MGSPMLEQQTCADLLHAHEHEARPSLPPSPPPPRPQLSQHVAALKYAGLAFTIGLAGAAGLEGFIGFCLGCWMFQLAIRFGLVSPAVRGQRLPCAAVCLPA